MLQVEVVIFMYISIYCMKFICCIKRFVHKQEVCKTIRGLYINKSLHIDKRFVPKQEAYAAIRAGKFSTVYTGKRRKKEIERVSKMLNTRTILALVAFLVGPAFSKWDGLRVTFGRDPTTFFRVQPRTVAAATAQGFVPVNNDNCTASSSYNGRAYVKHGDHSITLLYDVNGFIAGIQAGITTQEFNANNMVYPNPNVRPPFVTDGITNDRFIITAYFTDPSTICSVGRFQSDFDLEGTGSGLWLQTGSYPSNVTRIPMQESQVGAPWVEGRCFPVMGKHYWYNTTKTMDCYDVTPVFLLYNGGQLNAFGWSFPLDLASPNYEHPTAPVFPHFFSVIPDCLYQLPKMSTMHIFLTANPFINNC
ncbi:hypothetical protein RRG08_028499 [Elysia crispata]|uniref:Uncharacterized protein n=1 Tax=Elysia crispata TaxID=231223 RepID=A0AAE1DGM3_9GAST|nr:hypothetical protein RRG08_028499 [Elysia crispata]